MGRREEICTWSVSYCYHSVIGFAGCIASYILTRYWLVINGYTIMEISSTNSLLGESLLGPRS
jgi:hypothetical protein